MASLIEFHSLNEMSVAESDTSTQDTSTDIAMEVTNYTNEMRQF